jgi:hypothetical protein
MEWDNRVDTDTDNDTVCDKGKGERLDMVVVNAHVFLFSCSFASLRFALLPLIALLYIYTLCGAQCGIRKLVLAYAADSS